MATPVEQSIYYPATVIGYFEAREPAEAALAELEGMDFGELQEGFEKANIFYRDVPGQMIITDEGVAVEQQSIDKNAPADLPGDVAVVARGQKEKLVDAVRVMEAHGAYKVSNYGDLAIEGVENQEFKHLFPEAEDAAHEAEGVIIREPEL